ncbi:SRPRA-like protein [Mya arenaria]|uniref:SRPRA-like protein n=1 Tax=Mya arenaria TaxID=6604 RepID=A0ABY7E5M8_MYAAR|nr:SRPRA-like protein [Mya arenaria]
MLDFFTIFSKGGIVLWYFQGTSQLFTAPVNSLIRSVILQERSGSNQFTHEALTLKYKLDNEFELVFVVAYQKILQLSYVDKFLDTIQLEFRNKYKDDLQNGAISGSFDFRADFDRILFDIEQETRKQTQKGRVMKTFEESDKSRKTSSPKPAPTVPMATSNLSNGELDEETIRQNLVKKFGAKKKTPKAEPWVQCLSYGRKSPDGGKKKGKVGTKWEMGGTSKDLETLDFNKGTGDNMNGQVNVKDEELQQVGTMGGELKNIETDSESEEEEEEEVTQTARPSARIGKDERTSTKNVASDIAQKLCDSVAVKLEGKTLGTFSSISTTVKTALNESCLQILRPRRRICFWLVENGFRVMIAACDTFRAGAVEQLRTHTRKLNALHPPEKHAGQQMVQLYEKGYGKDAAGIAMEAINFARDCHIDVVLVDTAGRMQDNEPLMRALAKLIKVNQPDLVLFVGEALVGNEAVDQLTKFNQALADHSNMTNPRLIDGIILSKFDTIDDKTYTDLRNLNAKAVVHALLK